MSPPSTAARLFEPCRIGPLTLRNRTVRAAAFEGMCEGHEVTPRLLDYHRSVAAGGVGMTTVAYAAVEQSGLSFPHQLWLRPQAVPGLRQLTDAVHAEGAAAGLQIGHSGNMAHAAVAGGRPLSASSLPNLYGPNWPRAMDAADIARVVASFASAVHLAAEAGFDAVEVHAGHGYLISQFLSPRTNRRRDGYGGPLAARIRFLLEVLEAVTAAAGQRGLAVLVKMNLRDGFRGGCTVEDAIEIARALEQAGAHALVLSGGFVSRAPMVVMHGAMPTRTMARLVMPRSPLVGLMIRAFGGSLIAEVPYRSTYFLDDARRIRAAVRLPLVYIGGADSGEAILRVLGEGFDAVAMARSLIREPDFVNRLSHDPRATSPCDHCNYCAARIYTTHMACHHREPPPPELRALVGAHGAR